MADLLRTRYGAHGWPCRCHGLGERRLQGAGTTKTAHQMTLAFQTGLRQLWRERTLGRYLRGEVARGEAIQAVGIDWVVLAERQHEAMMEDLAWALGE